MKRAVAWTVLAAMSVYLTGCSLFRTTRIVQKTQAPDAYKTVTVETLQQDISARDAAIQTLKASVLLTATTGGGTTGKVTQYTELKGFIFVRKPHDLNVILQLPIFGSQAVNMVSDANQFKLLINFPTVHRAIIGTNEVTKPSKNGLENLRPAVFFDSLLVPGVASDEYVARTESLRLLTPTGRNKPLIEEPDYDLTLMKLTNDHHMRTTRLIHISRVDLLPIEQDIYDEQGRIVTTATYSRYETFNGQKFPTVIKISRPLDEYSLKLEITKLTLNEKLEDDQFVLEIPAGVPVQKMD